MKVILYAAISINGMIANKVRTWDWLSPEDQKSFFGLCHQSGGVIMGRKSIELFKDDGLDNWPNGDGLHIILTRNKNFEIHHPNIKLASSPQDAIKIASESGLNQVVVGGGAEVYTIFMKENLVDEIFLDVEPFAFADGLSFFKQNIFETNLKFISSKMLSPQTIQLHYKVLK